VKRRAEPSPGLTGRERPSERNTAAGFRRILINAAAVPGYRSGRYRLPSNGACARCPGGVYPSGSATDFFRGLRRSETTGATLPHTGGSCRPARFRLIPGSGLQVLLVPRGGRPADDRHGLGSRAGRRRRSAFWRVFLRRSTVQLWAARPDG
jgi:hypothetical protein